MYVSSISENRIRSPTSVISWIISPIPRRIISHIASVPKSVENYRSYVVNRLINIVVSV